MPLLDPHCATTEGETAMNVPKAHELRRRLADRLEAAHVNLEKLRTGLMATSEVGLLDTYLGPTSFRQPAELADHGYSAKVIADAVAVAERELERNAKFLIDLAPLYDALWVPSNGSGTPPTTPSS